jgi:hypothetical protein
MEGMANKLISKIYSYNQEDMVDESKFATLHPTRRCIQRLNIKGARCVRIALKPA